MQLIKRWVIHSIAQNIINGFPKKLSYKIYFFVQKKFGRLSDIDSIFYLERSLLVIQHVKKHIKYPETILELGTGRTVTTLIGLWILGVKKMTTIDLNPYLSEELTKKYMCHMLENSEKIFELFKNDVSKKEFYEKMSFLSELKDSSIGTILEKLNIQYLPNQDARKLDVIGSESIDFYYSDQVLEHVPKQIIEEIVKEGERILSEKGIFLHFVGLHDHFATIDSTISKINFLKFSTFIWHILAGNKFMYHNRLRVSDYDKIVEQCRFLIIDKEVHVDKESLILIEKGFKLNQCFKKYCNEELATTSLTLICEKAS